MLNKTVRSMTSNPRFKLYMSEADPISGIPVCFLVASRLEHRDSGNWMCKSSHADANLYEVVSKVLVYGTLFGHIRTIL